MVAAQGWASKDVIELPSINSVTFKVYTHPLESGLFALVTNELIYLHDSFRSPFLPRLGLERR